MTTAGAAAQQPCPGCGAELPPVAGPVHAYLTSSPACWHGFGELLAADYASPERMGLHQVVVDTYAAQHPGAGRRRQVQSVGLHLMTLALFLEHGTDPALGTALHRRMIRRPRFHPSDADRRRNAPPCCTVPTDGPASVARVAAYEWAGAVWETYRHEHDTVRAWLREAGFAAEKPQDRLTALTSACSDAVVMLGETPQPHSTRPPTATSRYAAACASSPAPVACSW